MSSYVTYPLIEILSEDEEEVNPLVKEDEEMIEERLRTLGCLDWGYKMPKLPDGSLTTNLCPNH